LLLQSIIKSGQDVKTFEQKRTLGLCYKCNKKYYPGHKCVGKPLNLLVGHDEDTIEGTREEEEIDQNCVLEEDGEEVDAVISMYASDDKKQVTTMKFKGQD
jgi:hypothetical protein